MSSLLHCHSTRNLCCEQIYLKIMLSYKKKCYRLIKKYKPKLALYVGPYTRAVRASFQGGIPLLERKRAPHTYKGLGMKLKTKPALVVVSPMRYISDGAYEVDSVVCRWAGYDCQLNHSTRFTGRQSTIAWDTFLLSSPQLKK